MQVPRVLGTTVSRDRLLRKMESGVYRGSAVLLISAPAGAGKTMLLAQRTRQLRSSGKPVAWLSLAEEDNESRSLWSGILAACRQAARGVHAPAEEALAALKPPATVDAGFVDAFISAASAFPQGLWLVLDDVHEVTAPDTLNGLARLLTHLPPEVCVMLGCRHDPPLPIPRLILAGTAAEIRAADLAFNRDETRQLLCGHDIHLSDEDLDLLLAKTEGWAAGLRLAALSLTQQEDASGYLGALAGDDRAVAAYLVTEVIRNQSVDTVAFLLATAVPEWLTIELACALSRRDDAGAILNRLVRDNALVFRRDSSPRTYRYHSLLRSYLLAELTRRDVAAQRELNRIASDWYAKRGEPLLALSHAAKAHDKSRVASLVDHHGLQLIMTEGGAALAKVLGEARDAVLAEPVVTLIAAMSALLDGEASGAGRYLDHVGRDVAVHRDQRLRLLHATALLYEARLRGERPAATSDLIGITSTGVIDDPDLGLLARAAHGMTMIDLGDAEAADADLAEAFELALQRERDYVALDCLGHLTRSAAAMSDFAGMVTRAERAIGFAAERGWAMSSPMVRIYVSAGWGAWQLMDVDAAERYVSLATAINSDANRDVLLPLQLLATYVDFTRTNDWTRLRVRLDESWAHTEAGSLMPKEVSSLSLLELRTALSHGHNGWADAVIGRAGDLLGDVADVDVLDAMVHTHHGRSAAARQALGPIVNGERVCSGVNAQIAAWLLEAHLATANDEVSQARNAVTQAIELAASHWALRNFVTTASDSVRELLIAGKGGFGAHEDFVARAVAAMREVPPGHDTLLFGEPLTARELELLRDLPSLLTLKEIAAAHVVSVNTVKSHLNALYRKLKVSSRRAAVERANELGLL